ncbi:MAG: BatD family protein, partial [Spirochaetales bacterium]|nr:BatD family protein [Spirochaetales bacterium]
MEISPNPVGRGDKFTVDFFIDYDDMTGISIETPELPFGISLFKGPYKRPYWFKLDDGSSRKKTIVTYTYSTNTTGRFVLGSYHVSAGTDIFVTKAEVIRIGLYRNRKLYMPYDIEWSFSEGTFYEGQAVSLILEVRNLEEVMLFEDVTVSLPDKGFMESVKNLGFVSEQEIGNYSLYTVPVRGYIFTPASAGRLKIPSASISARGVTSVSDSSYLTVLEIPEQIKNTGAIGDFGISYWLKNDELSRNEKIELHVIVEGTGNLNYLQLQEPSGDGLTLVNTVEVSNYESSIKGYSGSRETVYSFISDSPGDKALIVPAFPFLDPESANIITGSEKRIFLNVATDIIVEVDDAAPEDFPFYP